MRFAHKPLCMPENKMRIHVIDKCKKHKQAHLGCSMGVSQAHGGFQLSVVISFRPALSDLMHLAHRAAQFLRITVPK